MSNCVRILCVDDERNVLRALERIFLDDDYEILTATSGEDGLRLLDETPDVQVVLSDYRMPGMNGVEFLRQVYGHSPDTIRIVLSGYADTASVVAAINEGKIYKFVPKPWNDDELRITVNKAIEAFNLQRRNRQLTEELQEKNEELLQMNEELERLVTERTSELLLQNRALLHTQNVLQNLPVGVIGILPDGVVALINSEAEQLTGKTTDEVLGEKMRDVFPGDLCAVVADAIAARHVCRDIQLQCGPVKAKCVHLLQELQEGTILILDREC